MGHAGQLPRARRHASDDDPRRARLSLVGQRNPRFRRTILPGVRSRARPVRGSRDRRRRRVSQPPPNANTWHAWSHSQDVDCKGFRSDGAAWAIVGKCARDIRPIAHLASRTSHRAPRRLPLSSAKKHRNQPDRAHTVGPPTRRTSAKFAREFRGAGAQLSLTLYVRSVSSKLNSTIDCVAQSVAHRRAPAMTAISERERRRSVADIGPDARLTSRRFYT